MCEGKLALLHLNIKEVVDPLLSIMRSEWLRMWARKKTKVLLGLYLGLLLFVCLFLWGMGVSFYNPEHDIRLNSLNTSPFLFRELYIFLAFVFVPLLAIDTFNGEYRSGALRMVLIRPLDRWRILTAKLLLLGILLFVLIMLTMVVGIGLGLLLMPKVTETTFYQTEVFDLVGAWGYILQYYLLGLLILLVVSGVAMLVSLLMPNGVFAYLGVVGFLVGGLYFSSRMDFLLGASDAIFRQLAPDPEANFIGLSLCFVIISVTLSFLIWQRRDFTA